MRLARVKSVGVEIGVRNVSAMVDAVLSKRLVGVDKGEPSTKMFSQRNVYSALRMMYCFSFRVFEGCS
jgi:hypothetical protein